MGPTSDSAEGCWGPRGSWTRASVESGGRGWRREIWSIYRAGVESLGAAMESNSGAEFGMLPGSDSMTWSPELMPRKAKAAELFKGVLEELKMCMASCRGGGLGHLHRAILILAPRRRLGVLAAFPLLLTPPPCQFLASASMGGCEPFCGVGRKSEGSRAEPRPRAGWLRPSA